MWDLRSEADEVPHSDRAGHIGSRNGRRDRSETMVSVGVRGFETTFKATAAGSMGLRRRAQ